MNPLCSIHRPSGRTLAIWALAALVGWAALAPGAARADGPVEINNISYEVPRHSVVLDITGPVTISTRSLKAPPRLVVDIPTARLLSKNRELIVGDALVKRVRVSQFKIFPPVVRVVIETATAAEPLIAVQQTQKQLFITLAPAREGDGDSQGSHGNDGHDHAHPEPAARPTAAPILPAAPVTPAPPVLRMTPAPAPTPVPVLIPSPLPTPIPTLLPVPPSVRPTLAPTPRPTPVFTPEPTPVPTPSRLQPTAPSSRPETPGEAGKETMPGWLQP